MSWNEKFKEKICIETQNHSLKLKCEVENHKQSWGKSKVNYIDGKKPIKLCQAFLAPAVEQRGLSNKSFFQHSVSVYVLPTLIGLNGIFF